MRCRESLPLRVLCLWCGAGCDHDGESGPCPCARHREHRIRASDRPDSSAVGVRGERARPRRHLSESCGTDTIELTARCLGHGTAAWRRRAMDVPVNASIFPQLDEIPQQVRLARTIEQREDPLRRRPAQVGGPAPGRRVARLPAERRPAGSPTYRRLSPPDRARGARRARSWHPRLEPGARRWPTMPIEGRIRAVEQFGWRMKDRRDDVVRC